MNPGSRFLFQSPLGEVVKEISTKRKFWSTHNLFQSPLGEVVKETSGCLKLLTGPSSVSIPSRGSGKGDDNAKKRGLKALPKKFQSPLGEVVKETSSLLM